MGSKPTLPRFPMTPSESRGVTKVAFRREQNGVTNGVTKVGEFAPGSSMTDDKDSDLQPSAFTFWSFVKVKVKVKGLHFQAKP